MPMTSEQRATLEDVTQFVYHEARLQDEHRYDDWESLWTDDGVYWVPANGDGGDPEKVMSIIYDNRSRIALRIRQFHTGKRFSQTPQSRLRRLISNIEVLEDDGRELSVGSNVLIFENQTRGDVLWAARTEYRLRRMDGQLRMARKTVTLVNNQDALYSMAFLI
ncbi:MULTISPECIES: aromatic-ring-hydroxylating dioxygenase subunit beta [Hydrogenophaga]|uniref:aromatic-ring-hydroxylating dioxygenase subunit beta n=1 Tax=Hydrogenophaga TaxID=47420 RepID=UPI000878EABC|nr:MULTISPECIES: aromatic-ring-hydroxylating dioxygenase subunit beta [unclassified Hydrogenophaga]MBN9373750.1 aromatic-ring-hydroxylating dioxygenase subunit beta [Hydrogenophaga sp.]OJV42822.1 MAG: ring-hydroxylating dioxygenase subunit beta [Hydrogenophaga sp. 70-12]